MKTFLYILTLVSILLTGCSNETKDTHKDAHESNHAEEKEHHDGATNEVELTDEQIQLADLQIETLQKSIIKDELSVVGEIQVPPQSKATVYSPIEAFVEKATLLPGDKVKKGQAIATLKHPKFIEIQQQYLEALIKLKNEEANYQRKKTLFEQDIVSKKNFLLAESSYLTTKSYAESHASQLQLIGFSPKNIEHKGIQTYLTVFAPISGYITVNNMNRGKHLSTNELMYEIINNEHIHVELQVFAKDLNTVKVNAPILFSVRGIDKEYEGTVSLIGTKIKADSKTADIHGHFEDPEQIIKPGMFVEARILSGGTEGYAIPESAIIEKEETYYVFTPKTKNRFKQLKIEKGVSQKGRVQLKSIEGNNFNIPLVTKGAYYLKGALLQQSGEMGGHHH